MATVTFTPTSVFGPTTPTIPGGGAAITPSDADVFNPAVVVYVGGAGVVAAVPANSTTGAAVNVTVPAGGYVPFRCSAVKATNTTATLLVAVF